ncbi:MAG TPA: threonine--tRNA ligase, partial [Candidatus Marinimicrobia bacterium]|nr:threonine--tRNA ligase [Candidatus Neomarinimicrobiota bacterium]
FLLEHFGGDFPLWLAPKQVIILPISDKYLSYANALENKLFENNIRVSIDARSEKMGAKIRDAEINKIPIMLVVGEKEEKDGSASVRRRHSGDLGSKSVDELIPEIVEEIINRRRA